MMRKYLFGLLIAGPFLVAGPLVLGSSAQAGPALRTAGPASRSAQAAPAPQQQNAGQQNAAQQNANVPQGNAANGRKLFVSFGCYECHGYEAQGSTATGPRLAPRPIPYAQ